MIVIAEVKCKIIVYNQPSPPERGREREEVEGNGNLRENRGVYIVSLLCFVCSLPVLCLVPVCLLFSVFCSLLSVNQSNSSVI